MSLSAQLERQQSLLEDLFVLLRREQDLLLQGKADGLLLERLAESKAACFKSLERVETARLEAQRLLGFDADHASAGLAAQRAGCLGQWQVIQDMSRRAAHLNRLNGGLIQQRLAHNQRVLAGLRLLGGDSLYDASGLPRKSPGRLQSQA